MLLTFLGIEKPPVQKMIEARPLFYEDGEPAIDGGEHMHSPACLAFDEDGSPVYADPEVQESIVFWDITFAKDEPVNVEDQALANKLSALDYFSFVEEEQKPREKRKRRTKAQMEADRAKVKASQVESVAKEQAEKEEQDSARAAEKSALVDAEIKERKKERAKLEKRMAAAT